MLRSAARQLPSGSPGSHTALPQARVQLGAAQGRAHSRAVPRSSTTPTAAAAAAKAAATREAPVAQAAGQRRVRVAERPRRSAEGRLLLKDLTFPELQEWCCGQGQSAARAAQLWRWLYRGEDAWRRAWAEPHRGPQDLSRAFREWVSERASLSGGLERISHTAAADGTVKLLHRLTDGEGAGQVVESVLIPKAANEPQGGGEGGGSRGRTTLCVSSQVGCAQNCQFCYTGRMGLRAQLSTAHIVQQVLEAQRYRAEHNAALQAMAAAHQRPAGPTAPLPPVTSVVYMGMGEPLHNLDAVLASTAILTQPQGLHLSPNRVSVSTVGLLPELRRFCAASSCQVALSLHATTDEVRSWIAPVNRRYPLGELLSTLRELFPRQGPRTVLVEYVMLAGVNDSLEDAARLLEQFADVNAKFNLIGFNAHEGTLFRASPPEQIAAFRGVLLGGRRVCTVRSARGDDEMAACGQLGDLAAAGPPGGGPPRGAPTLRPPESLRHAVAGTA